MVMKPPGYETAHQLLIEVSAPQLLTEPTAVTKLALRQTVPTELISVAKLFRRETAPQPVFELILALLLPSCETVLQRMAQLTVPQGQEFISVM